MAHTPQDERIQEEARSLGMDIETYWQRIIDGLASERAAETRRMLFEISEATAMAAQRREAEEYLRQLANGPIKRDIQPPEPRPLVGFGKYSGLPTGSEEFAQRKQDEKAKEDRSRRVA